MHFTYLVRERKTDKVVAVFRRMDLMKRWFQDRYFVRFMYKIERWRINSERLEDAYEGDTLDEFLGFKS